ncbi:MAG: NAD(P)H-quinone oxidoreductase, partial [Acidobacteriota bacterium]
DGWIPGRIEVITTTISAKDWQTLYGRGYNSALKMKAVVIKQPGNPSVLQLQEVEDPLPAADEIQVRVRATALNRADLLQRRGLYPAPPGVRKDIPGLEFAGEIIALGARVTAFKAGDRVMGLLPGEGYAGKIVTHERMAIPIPDCMSFEEAASIPEVFMTAYDALIRQLDLKIGERILIHAVGSGVGIAAVQLAKTAGAWVFGTAGSDEKLSKAKVLGLDRGINYKREDFQEVVRAETGNQGVNAILDVVGSSYWEKNLACLAPQGRIILVGLLSGAKAQTDLGLILRKRLQIIGTVLRTRPLEEKMALTQELRSRLLPLFESGQIRPVIDGVFPLEKAAQAHAYMEENKNFGKIVLRVAD